MFHHCLNHVVVLKIAVVAILADFCGNLRNEDCFEISGLSRIADKIASQAWQDQALCYVQGVLAILRGAEISFVCVQKTGLLSITVEFSCVAYGGTC